MRSVTIRALNILGAFTKEHPALTLSEISRNTGEPVSTCHRFLTDLLEWGAVDRFGRVYTLGRRLWSLGLVAPVHTNIKEAATPYMQDVLFATRHVVNLQVRVAHQALMVERISGTKAGEPALGVGDVSPLHASAGGKVLFAHAPQDIQDLALQNASRLTPATKTDHTEILQELEKVRLEGWATTHGELHQDMAALGVPVRNLSGEVTAALSVVMIGATPNVGRLLPVLHVAARAIGRQWVITSDL